VGWLGDAAEQARRHLLGSWLQLACVVANLLILCVLRPWARSDAPENAGRRYFGRGAMMLLLATFFGYTPVYRTVDAAAHIPNLSSFLMYGLGAASLLCLQGAYLSASRPAAEARRMMRWRKALMAACLAGMTACLLLAAGQGRPDDAYFNIATRRSGPEYAFWALFLLMAAPFLGSFLYHSLSLSGKARGGLRAGLRLTAVGAAMCLTHFAYQYAVFPLVGDDYVLWRQSGGAPGAVASALATAGLAGGLLIVIGAALPVLLPWARRIGRRRALAPLRRDLRRALPSAPPPPRASLPALLAPGETALRAQQEIIWIRDRLRALEMRLDPAFAAAVRRAARDDRDAQALTLACLIDAALTASGAAKHEGPGAPGAFSAGGASEDDEATLLRRAQQLRGSDRARALADAAGAAVMVPQPRRQGATGRRTR
jgi:hypothetical protein